MPSTLLIDECYATQGAGFVGLLRECADDRYLGGLANRIIGDARPWVREQVLAYVDTPLDRPGHHPLVKRLFKHAERQGDAAALAHLLVGLDRTVRRVVVRRHTYDWRTRTTSESEELVVQRKGLKPLHQARHAESPPERPKPWWAQAEPPRARPGTPLFSIATRHHLRRRAWRFFRHLGFQHPDRYVAALTPALLRYTDADLAQGHDLLTCWGLAHALFGESPVLAIQGTWINLAPGRTLAELVPAPAFPACWAADTAVPWLLDLVVGGQSRLVRTWARELLQAQHAAALTALPLEVVRRLLDATWDDVRQLGLELFARHPQLPTLTVREWLALLTVADPLALARIAEVMAVHVRGSRLDHAAAVDLACHRAVPVVRLALGWLAEKDWADETAGAALLGLRRASCPALAGDLGRFLLDRLGIPGRYRVEHVLLALDHRLPGMREAAMAWVDANRHAREDGVLWARAAESPYDAVRGWLLRALEHAAAQAAVDGDQRRLLWSTVLLGVHRGGRERQAALRQVTQAAIAAPQRADELLPLLAAALRSLRPPERRAACAAIATVRVARPELAAGIAALFPELAFAGPLPPAGSQQPAGPQQEAV